MADALREQLLAGELAPGTPMRDMALSARVGVSRTTMRQALALLAREGLLTHALNRGVEVARLAPGDVADIYALRRLLEVAGAEALLARDAPELDPLDCAVRDMAAAAARRDRRRVVEADVAFHSAIVAALENRRLQLAMGGAMKELRLALSVTDRAYDDLDEQLRQHRVLLDRFRGHDANAVQALEEHLRRSEAMVCAALGATAPKGAQRP